MHTHTHRLGFQALQGRQSACSAGDTGDVQFLGLEDSFWRRKKNKDSSILCLENPQREERGGLQSIVVAKGRSLIEQLNMTVLNEILSGNKK